MTDTQAPYRTRQPTPGAAFVCRLPYITCLDCECRIDADPPPPDMLCGTCRERADEAQRDHRVREAAHEMLAALEGAERKMAEENIDVNAEYQAVVDAIAKARGEGLGGGMSKPDGGRAFPVHPDTGQKLEGMSLRDWFAGMALQGMYANPKYLEACKGTSEHRGMDFADVVAMSAYENADAMIAERERGDDG